jgi:hypothetical protein
MKFTHFRARVHRWVLWWFYVGIVCGVVALVNILSRDLSRSQVRFILALGVLHWLLGGLVCYACDGIRIEEPHQPPQNERRQNSEPVVRQQNEWYAPSDFLLPGNRKSLLPPRW